MLSWCAASVVERLGEDAYTDGYQVVTTLDSRLQPGAVNGVRAALLEYERRHGYKGPLDRIAWPPGQLPGDWPELLEKYSGAGTPARRAGHGGSRHKARFCGLRMAARQSVGWPGLEWAVTLYQ